MNTRKTIISLGLILLLACLLRFAGITSESLWLDESYQTLVGASGHGVPDLLFPEAKKILFRFEPPAEPEQMLKLFRKVDPLCPPLYALSLNRWIKCFGSSDFAMRSLSALISVSAVTCLSLGAAVLFGWPLALLAGLLQAVSPYDIYYAQELRMYSLVELSGAVSCLSLIAIVKSRFKQAAAYLLLPLYAVSTAAMVNSHYTTLFLGAAQFISATTYLIYQRKFAVLGLLLLAWISCAALCLPWLSMFLESASSRKESFYVAREASWFWPFKALFIRIPVNFLSFLSGQRVTAYAAGIYLSSSFMLLSALYFGRKERKHAFLLNCCWLWALLPALLLWLADTLEGRKVVEVSRYLIFTAPAIFLLAGYGLQKLSRFKRLYAGLLAFHLFFAAINLVYGHTVRQKEAWKEMAAQVEELVDPEQVLVVSQYYNIACIDRYLKRERKQLGLSPAMGKEVIAERLGGLDNFALLTAQDGESIKDLLPDGFELKKQVDLPHGLHLRIFQKRSG